MLRWLALGVAGFFVWRYMVECTTCGPRLQVTTPRLQMGDRGHDVAQLQTALNFLNYQVGPVDGIFGPQTQEAVRKFQIDNGLENNGVADREFYAALDVAMRREGGRFVYLGV